MLKNYQWTSFELRETKNLSIYQIVISKNFSDLISFLEKNCTSCVQAKIEYKKPPFGSIAISLQVERVKKSRNFNLMLEIPNCVNESYELQITMKLPYEIEHNSEYPLRNKIAKIPLAKYCPVSFSGTQKSAITATTAVQTSTSSAMNFVVIFASSINIQTISASNILSASKFLKFNHTDNLRTVYIEDSNSGYKPYLNHYFLMKELAKKRKELAKLKAENNFFYYDYSVLIWNENYDTIILLIATAFLAILCLLGSWLWQKNKKIPC